MAQNDLLNFSVDNSVEKTEDFIGFEALDTGFYEFTLKECFINQSQSGAVCIVLNGTMVPEGDTSARPQPYSESVYFRSSNDKGNAVTYERNGKLYKLPGLVLLDNMCEILTGKALNKQDTDERLVQVWENGEQVTAPRSILSDLEDQLILVAVEKAEINKREQNAAGQYVEIAETRFVNSLVMALTSDGHTYNEHIDGTQETVWKNKWSKNVGKVRNKVKKTVGGGFTKAATGAKPTLTATKKL